MQSWDFSSGSNSIWLKYCRFSGPFFISWTHKGKEGSTPRPPLSPVIKHSSNLHRGLLSFPDRLLVQA